MHDAGENRSNDDEVRIQLSRSTINKQSVRAAAGDQTAFVGFFKKGDVFVAWDPRHVYALRTKTIASVYARHSQRMEALAHTASVHMFNSLRFGQMTGAIAMPSNAIGLYLENINLFHRLGSEEAIRTVLSETSPDQAVGGLGKKSPASTGGDERKRVKYYRNAYQRDPHFTEQVLLAYDGRCCVCGRQLGLVQAAHIIPHSQPDSTDSVQNGLALCVEHHKFYDDGLLMPGPERKLVFSDKRATFLMAIDQGAGLEGIELFVNRGYSVPRESSLHPDDKLLLRGLNFRKGT